MPMSNPGTLDPFFHPVFISTSPPGHKIGISIDRGTPAGPAHTSAAVAADRFLPDTPK